jgi:hypothetical protein
MPYHNSVSFVVSEVIKQNTPALLTLKKVKLSHYRPGQALGVPGG